MGNERVPGTSGLTCSAEEPDGDEESGYDAEQGVCYARPSAVPGECRGPDLPPVDEGPRLFAVTGEVPIPSPLTPEALARVYLDLPVRYREPATGTTRTMRAAAKIYTNIAIANRTPNLTEKDALVQAVRSQASDRLPERLRRVEAPPRAHSLSVAHAFFGKGLPSEVSMTLSYAITLGRCTPEGLQTYCDDLRIAGIGLDCSGFVNAFFFLTRPGWTERYLGSFRAPALQRRTSASVMPEDVLVWEQSDSSASAHIAIVSRRVSDDQFIVVESTGSMGGPNAQGRAGGLSISTYRIPDADAGGVVTVTRGNGTTSTVKVFGVPRSG